MLTTTEITNLIATPPSGTSSGKLAYIAARAKKTSAGTTRKQAAFLEDAKRMHPSTRDTDPQETYNHPSRTPKDRRRGGGPLTPVELAWLQRLPTDPTETTYDDAAALASLHADISRMDHPTDARLVASHWEPVAEFHDTNAATVALTNASQPLTPVPHSAHEALAEAVLAENRQLNPAEAAHRAASLLEKAKADRSATKDAAITTARDKITALAAATEARQQVTRH